MMEGRKAYEEKLDAQLNEWNAQITLLKAKAENAKAECCFLFKRRVRSRRSPGKSS